MNREHASLEALPGANLAQVGVVEQSVLVKLVFHIGKRELRAPHRHVEFGKNPRKRADVILVTVGKDNAANALAVLDEIGNIRNHNVDAEQFSLGEHKARVDHNNVVAPAHGHAVHTELAEASEGNNLQFSGCH